MEQALDYATHWTPAQGALGVAVDVYHTWWDPKLKGQIARANRRYLLAFHVCDWLMPTTDMLNDRGMMGDGIIDICKRFARWVEAGGFAGAGGRDLLPSLGVGPTRRGSACDLRGALPRPWSNTPDLH